MENIQYLADAIDLNSPYAEKYLEVIGRHDENGHGHHIVPVAFYKDVLGKKKLRGAHTIDMKPENIAYLSPEDHKRAHYYLTLCAKPCIIEQMKSAYELMEKNKDFNGRPKSITPVSLKTRKPVTLPKILYAIVKKRGTHYYGRIRQGVTDKRMSLYTTKKDVAESWLCKVKLDYEKALHYEILYGKIPEEIMKNVLTPFNMETVGKRHLGNNLVERDMHISYCIVHKHPNRKKAPFYLLVRRNGKEKLFNLRTEDRAEANEILLLTKLYHDEMMEYIHGGKPVPYSVQHNVVTPESLGFMEKLVTSENSVSILNAMDEWEISMRNGGMSEVTIDRYMSVLKNMFPTEYPVTAINDDLVSRAASKYGETKTNKTNKWFMPPLRSFIHFIVSRYGLSKELLWFGANDKKKLRSFKTAS